MKERFFIFLLCYCMMPNLWARDLKAQARGEGETNTEACYRAHGQIRRAMEKKCKDHDGVNYDTLELEDCDVQWRGKTYKATYKSEFRCKVSSQ